MVSNYEELQKAILIGTSGERMIIKIAIMKSRKKYSTQTGRGK